jgi:hypothetical protein
MDNQQQLKSNSPPANLQHPILKKMTSNDDVNSNSNQKQQQQIASSYHPSTSSIHQLDYQLNQSTVSLPTSPISSISPFDFNQLNSPPISLNVICQPNPPTSNFQSSQQQALDENDSSASSKGYIQEVEKIIEYAGPNNRYAKVLILISFITKIIFSLIQSWEEVPTKLFGKH